MWREILNPDVFLFIVLMGFTLFGWWFGAIHAVGSVVGTLAGAYVAANFNTQTTQWLLSQVAFPEGAAHVLTFFLTFFIVNRAVGFIFWIIDRSVDFARFIPFIRSINRIVGGIFGFIEGVLVLGLGIAYLTAFPFGEGVRSFFAESSLAPWLAESARVLYPLLPEAWDKVNHIFEKT